MVKRRQKKLKERPETEKKIFKTGNGVVLEKIVAKTEKEKLLLMRVGVVCIMVIFLVAWIFNLKYQFKINSNNNSSKSSFNWEQAKVELDKTMGQIKQGIAEIKQIQETKQQNTLPREPELTAEQINLLKGRLMDEAATGTMATSTVKN